MSHRYFSPNGDAQDDTTTVFYCLSKNATVTTTVVDTTGATVRTIGTVDGVSGYPGCSTWSHMVDWDGRDDSGTVLPDGVYTVRVHAVDAAGQSAQDEVQVGIDNRAPGALTRPAPGDVVSGSLDWTFTPATGFDLNTVFAYCDGAYLGRSDAPNPDGTFTGQGDSTTCSAGPNPVVAAVSWYDPFGYPQSWTSPAVSVTVNNAPGLRIYQPSSHRYFSPNGDTQDDTTTVLYCLSKNATVTTTITDAAGATVRTFGPTHDVSGNPGCIAWNHMIDWDGRDDGGLVVGDGVYMVADPRGGRERPVRPGRGAGGDRHPHTRRTDLPALR